MYAHFSAKRSLHPETDECFPLVCWLLNRSQEKVLEEPFLGRGQDFLCVYVSAGGGVIYTSQHMRHIEL